MAAAGTVAGANVTSGEVPPAAKVNINTATVAQLDTLPGIGPATADAIIKYRQKNGPFKEISEIQRVSGIKSAIFAKIEDLITVN